MSNTFRTLDDLCRIPSSAPTTRETADHAELAAIISDAEIVRVHGHANFGAITPREVVNDGVRKYAVGYHSGHTQLCILMEHGLITKPRPGSYDANLTKKGKKYARVLYRSQSALLSEIAALRGEVERVEADRIRTVDDRMTWTRIALQAERQCDELRKALELAAKRFETLRDLTDHVPDRIACSTWADEARQALANQGADQ